MRVYGAGGNQENSNAQQHRSRRTVIFDDACPAWRMMLLHAPRLIFHLVDALTARHDRSELTKALAAHMEQHGACV